MLKKIVKIHNVGRFKKFGASGDQELRKLNLIFAENGRGKTTVASILRSLKSGKPDYVLERATLGVAAAPEVDVLLTSGLARFAGGTWTVTCPTIEVFDERFVTDNVHVGERVETHNRRNLASVILGQKGADLSKKIKDLDDAARQGLAAIKTGEDILNGYKPASLSLAAFIALPPDPDVIVKLEAKARELEAAKQASSLQAQPLLTLLPVPMLPTTAVETLSKTIDAVAADAEKRVRAHLAQTHMQHAEEWLSEGLRYMTGETCPVCARPLAGVDIIDSYKAFFSDAYAALREEVDTLDRALAESLGAGLERRYQQALKANEGPIAFWREHLRFALPDAPDLEKFRVDRMDLLNQATGLIRAKKASLLDKIAPEPSLKAAVEKLEKQVSAVRAYNEAAASVNGEIGKLKASVTANPLRAIQTEHEMLVATKTRHSRDVAAKVQELEKVRAAREKANTDKDAAQKELGAYSKEVMAEYEPRINQILENFGAGFRIKGVQTEFPSGTPASTYKIEINSVAVEAEKVSDKPAPSFQTLLSGGDRSALALAFFVATLDHAPDKASKIVILDDPIGSQDEHRRYETCKLIHKYAGECAQIVVSSHEGSFLRQVWDGRNAAPTKCLVVRRAGDADSNILEWDIEAETKHPYLQTHDRLTAYVQGKETLVAADAAQKLRILLEEYLRFRFPNAFGSNVWLGDMIGEVRAAGAAHPMAPHLEELDAINAFTSPKHHGSSTTSSGATLNDTEVLTHARRTLKIVGGC